MDRDTAAIFVAGEVPELLPGGRVVLDFVGVDGESGGAPVLGRAIDRAVDRALGDLAGILGRDVVVRHLLEVERLNGPELGMGRDRVVGGDEDVPASAAGLQLGEELLIGAEHADLDLGAGQRLELLEILRLRTVPPRWKEGPPRLAATAASVSAPGHRRIASGRSAITPRSPTASGLPSRLGGAARTRPDAVRRVAPWAPRAVTSPAKKFDSPIKSAT